MGIVVAQASPQGHWEFRARIGGLLDLFATSSGLTLLAFQNPERAAGTLGQWGVPAAEALACSWVAEGYAAEGGLLG